MTLDSALDAALIRLVDQLGGDVAPGCSVLLYGSAARGDWDARRSDVNLLLVVDDPAPAALARLRTAVKGWHEAGYTPPLLIGRAEWQRATDVFPIELTDMHLAHRVLAGPDPLLGQSVAPEDLRAALESALRGKLMRLRQAYVRFHDMMPVLGGFATSSCSELLVLLRAVAVLLGRKPGDTADSAIDALADELGPGAVAIRSVASHRRDPDWSCSPELFAQYLQAVQCAADLVDTTSTGVS
jgi:hypothetical protein